MLAWRKTLKLVELFPNRVKHLECLYTFKSVPVKSITPHNNRPVPD